jgi:hypothetical protein
MPKVGSPRSHVAPTVVPVVVPRTVASGIASAKRSFTGPISRAQEIVRASPASTTSRYSRPATAGKDVPLSTVLR